MYSIPFVSATYVWRLCDVYVAYQRRTCGVSRVSIALVLRMCYVGLCLLLCIGNILWRSERILMRLIIRLLYKCFRFSEVMNQMFLTVRGCVQGSLRARLCLASVFVHVVSHPGWGAWRCPPSPSGFFFGVNLDFSGHICNL